MRRKEGKSGRNIAGETDYYLTKPHKCQRERLESLAGEPA